MSGVFLGGFVDVVFGRCFVSSNAFGWRVKLALGALMVMGLVSGCEESRYYREFTLDRATFDADAMEYIGKETGLALPKGTVGLHFRYEPPIDPSFVAKLELPPESLETMRAQVEAMKQNPIPVTGGLAKEVSWWKPYQGEVIAERESYQGNGLRLHVVLAREDGKLVAYIDWMT